MGMYVCLYVLASEGSGGQIDPLELELQEIGSHLMWGWELCSGPLQEQGTLLSTEASLRPPSVSIFRWLVCVSIQIRIHI